MKLMNDKKGTNGLALTAIILIALVVVSIGGVYLWDRFAPQEEETQVEAEIQAEALKTGDIASFKLSSEDNQDNPTRYAGTGYCWNTATPTKLKGGGSVTLSKTASTTIPSVTVNENLQCVAFSATHYGIVKDIKVEGESFEAVVSSRNISSSKEVRFEEDGSSDTGAIAIPASSTDTFNLWAYKANVADKGFNLKKVCWGREADNTSEIINVEFAGFTKASVPYELRNRGAYCGELATAVYIEDNNEEIFGAIKFTTSGSFTVPHVGELTFIDEAYYESVDGSIKLGTQTDTDTPADVGITNPTTPLNITVG